MRKIVVPCSVAHPPEVVPQVGPALRVEARWTARRGTAAAARGPCRSRCRAGAAGRPTASPPCGRRAPPARATRSAPPRGPRPRRAASRSPGPGRRSRRAPAGRPPRRGPGRRSRSRRRTAPGSAITSWPATVAVPDVGASSVVSIRRLVDLPAPFGPEERDELALPDVEVEAADGLDRLLPDPELPGQPLRVDHACTSLSALVLRRPVRYARIADRFCPRYDGGWRPMSTRAPACCGCCRSSRPTGSGAAASSPSGSR